MDNELYSDTKVIEHNNKEYLFISSIRGLNNIKLKTNICFYCEDCNSLTFKAYYRSMDSLLCKKCKTQRTCMQKYGVSWTAKVPSAIEKGRKTVTAHGGYTFQRKSSIEKVKHTMLEKYGVEHPMFSGEIKKKLFNTNYIKYGTKTAAQADIVKDKIKATNLERYGETSTLNTDKVKSAREKACIDKYGFPNAFYSATARHQKFYRKDNILFDSSWELYFYIYHTDMHSTIIREPVSISYKLANGTIRQYFPDFEVNGKLYEIKGDQFFNENGEPYCKLTDEYWYEKYQCMKDNNVIILKQADIEFYKRYVTDKYGFDYISQYLTS